MMVYAMPVLDGMMMLPTKLAMYDNEKLMCVLLLPVDTDEIMSCTHTHTRTFDTSGSEVY